MKQERKVNYTLSIILFVILFLFTSLVTLLKYTFRYDEGFSMPTILCFISSSTVLLLLLFVYALFCFLGRYRLIRRPKELAVICACIAIGYAACLFCEAQSVFLMPIFLTAFLMAPISKRKDTFTANIFCILMVLSVMLIEYHMIGTDRSSPMLAIISIVGLFAGSLAAFVLSYERKRLDFLVKSLAICIGSILLIFVLAYPIEVIRCAPEPAFLPLLSDAKWSVLAIFSQLILSLLLQPVFERVFNLMTNSRLIELTDHNSPLIHRLIKEAPGTFNHSLAVANFAEICATAIGENPYEARACAYYHDIGKLSNPSFFKENQDDENPHDNILPEVSVEIIRGHTVDGYKLCQKYHIPEEIARITVEHHGNMSISMFYYKAQGLTDSDVDINDYSYKGGVPTSKIAAIIMLCDAAEATIRSMDSPDFDKAEAALSKLIWSRLQDGQFDNCNITLKELSIIKNIIASSFGGVFHKRLKYIDNAS